MATLQCKLTWELSYTEQGGTYFRVSMHRLAHSEILLIKFFKLYTFVLKILQPTPILWDEIGQIWKWSIISLKAEIRAGEQVGGKLRVDCICFILFGLHVMWLKHLDMRWLHFQIYQYILSLKRTICYDPNPKETLQRTGMSMERWAHGALRYWVLKISSSVVKETQSS